MALRICGMSRKRWVLRVMRAVGRERRYVAPKQASPCKVSSPRRSPRRRAQTFLMHASELKASMRDCELALSGAQRERPRRDWADSAIFPWLLQLGQLEAEASSRTRSERQLFNLRDVLSGPGVSRDPVLPCGLRQDQALDLMSRDLTPEDFEMLSKLDEGLPKRNTVESDLVDQLPSVVVPDCQGQGCGVCLGEFEPGSRAVQLPCRHLYHPACISKWLTQCKNACPMCSLPIQRPGAEQARS